MSLIAAPSYPSAPRYSHEVPEADLHVTAAVEAAFAHGDEDALRAAYDAHGSMIYSFCCRTLPADRAKDVTQEVFVSAWRARAGFDPEKGSLAGWLTSIAKNRVIDNHRSEQRHASRRAEPGVIDMPVEAEVDHIGDRMLVTDALATLPERARRAIELAYFDGLSQVEIADRTGVPLGTVKSDIRRGLERIRDHLGAGS